MSNELTFYFLKTIIQYIFMTLFNKLNIQNDFNKNSLYPLNLLSQYLQNISTEEPPNIDPDIFELFIQKKP